MYNVVAYLGNANKRLGSYEKDRQALSRAMMVYKGYDRVEVLNSSGQVIALFTWLEA